MSLAWFEIERCVDVAKLRRGERFRKGLRDKHGYAADDVWDIEINSAAAECAVAKAIQRYWAGGVNTFKDADIGTNIQVRWSPLENARLIVRPEDPGEHWYVLVTGREDWFAVHGYILGREAKRDEWKLAPNGRPPCWMVPRQALSALPARLRAGVAV